MALLLCVAAFYSYRSIVNLSNEFATFTGLMEQQFKVNDAQLSFSSQRAVNEALNK
jgi:hypothetical protein